MSETNQNRRANHVSGACGIVFCASILLFLAGLWANHHANEPSLVVLLLIIPVITQLIGLGFIYWRDHIRSFSTYYACMMGTCVFTTYVLWILYNLIGASRSLSIVAVVATVFIAGFVVLMTIAIMRVNSSGVSNRKKQLSNLRSDVQKEPFLALLLFFSAFLCVSYLFGLAFAFYDKTLPHNGKPALFMKNIYAEPSASPASDANGNSVPKDATQRAAASFAIYFKTARAIPEIGNSETDKITSEAWKRNAKEIKETSDLRKKNHESFTDLLKKIREETENDGRLRIMLIGRADDTSTVGTPYSSNYELSQARAQNVQMKIMELLANPSEATSAQFKWRNIEWVIDPLSNEPDAQPMDALFPASGSGAIEKRGTTSNAANRIVNIRIEPVVQEFTSVQMKERRDQSNILPHKALDLMDYIYFANYTITTTGYGDITPTTPYSKFLCSLANIFEVFFLVVFFNTLLSIRKSDEATVARADKPGAPSSTADEKRDTMMSRFFSFLDSLPLIKVNRR